MNMQPMLFIGGSKDGEWITVDSDQQYIQIPVIPKISIEQINNEHIENIQCTVDTYRREFIATTEKRYQLYVIDSYTPEIMIGRLINGYQIVKGTYNPNES